MAENLEVLNATVSQLIRAALLTARFSGRMRQRYLRRLVTWQRLPNRTASTWALVHKVTPWARDRNTRQRGVHGEFRTRDTPIKLKHLSPKGTTVMSQ